MPSKRIQRTGQLLFASLTAVILLACQASSHSPGSSLPPLHVRRLQSVGYDLVNAYVFAPYCYSCHTGAQRPNLSNFSSVMNELGSIEYTCLQTTNPGKMMPKRRRGGLPLEQKKLLRLWINQGAPKAETKISDNRGAGRGSTITFKEVYSQVLERSCTRCHKAGNKWKLKNYADIAAVRAQFKKIVFTTSMDYMPPKHDPPKPPLPKRWMENTALTPGVNRHILTKIQKAIFHKWIEEGMPE